MNGITAFIDGSNIYGSDDETSTGLRNDLEVAGANGEKTIIPGGGAQTKWE